MRYRKNPITGEYVITDSYNNHSQSFYEYFDSTVDIIKLTDKTSANITKDTLIKTFSSYIKQAETIVNKNSEVCIASIVKNIYFENNQANSQIYIYPRKNKIIPDRLIKEEQFFVKHNKCGLCSIINDEQTADSRIIASSDKFIAFAPFFAILPYEIHIAPLIHQPDFISLSNTELIDLAQILNIVIEQMTKNLTANELSINITHIKIPDNYKQSAHWFIQVIPWVSNWAGFEIGCSTHINTTTPESSAIILKQKKQ